MGSKVKLISRLDYPVSISYGDEIIRLSPRAKEVVSDPSLLGTLPKGVITVRIK